MSEGFFTDGLGPKSKGTPAEFASDWHYERHLDDLERNLAGLLHRVEELKAMKVAQEDMDAAEQAVSDARKLLTHYRPSQKSAAKRPRASAKKETRG